MDLSRSAQAGADINIWGRDRDGPGSLLEVSMKDDNSPVEVLSLYHHQNVHHERGITTSGIVHSFKKILIIIPSLIASTPSSPS